MLTTKLKWLHKQFANNFQHHCLFNSNASITTLNSMPDLYENLLNSSHSKQFLFGQFWIWGAGDGTNSVHANVLITAAWIGNSPFCFLLISTFVKWSTSCCLSQCFGQFTWYSLICGAFYVAGLHHICCWMRRGETFKFWLDALTPWSYIRSVRDYIITCFLSWLLI